MGKMRWWALILLSYPLSGMGGCQGSEGAGPSLPSRVPSFDALRAWEDLKAQVAFGPRVPNTEGHRKAKDYILQELGKVADGVTRQEFSHQGGGKTFALTNILATLNPGQRPRILLGAHWDTRPFADQEQDPSKRRQPVPGANDGASGVAILLEIGRALKRQPPPVEVLLAFFDAEDMGGTPYAQEYCLGSRHFARNMGTFRPDMAIIVDMVGDKDLQIYYETYSMQAAPNLMRTVFDVARSLGFTAFHPFIKYTIVDDHLSLIEAGVPAIDLIDFDYPAWHTLDDTPEQCSPESLRAVGQTLLHVLYERLPQGRALKPLAFSSLGGAWGHGAL